jgi:hypothetical protein
MACVRGRERVTSGYSAFATSSAAPPSHQTFQGRNFVICSFVPRRLDYDPQAVPISCHHSNLLSAEADEFAKDLDDGKYASSWYEEPGTPATADEDRPASPPTDTGPLVATCRAAARNSARSLLPADTGTAPSSPTAALRFPREMRTSTL